MDFTVDVQVALKPGVIDAEGGTIEKSLRLLGYSQVRKVSTLKFYRIVVEGQSEKEVESQMEDACRKLLANPVIQNYQIKVSRK